MTASGSGRSPERLERALFTGAMLLQSLALLAALGVFAYLGSFSRYRADDYCDTASVRAAGLGAVIERYSLGQWRAADRYSNMLFVWFSESLGPRNLPFILAAMILLWVAALVWMAHELRRLASIQWPAWLDFFLPALLAFLAILQAPNRFQTLYWRSGMATHFAPLVLMCLLAAFVLRQVRTSKSALPSPWIGVLVCLAAFLIGGFSEPPVAAMIAAGVLALLTVARFVRGPRRRFTLVLLAWLMAGAVAAFLVMFFSPAHRGLGDSRVDLPALAVDTLRYTFEFMLDSLKVYPLPTAVSVLVPGLLVLALYTGPDSQRYPRAGNYRLLLLVAAVFLVVFILVAASFAPSAYGQSYPVGRARFLGRVLMTAGLMLTGSLLGLMVASLPILRSRRSLAYFPIALALLLSGLYPLRSFWANLSGDLPEYRRSAAAWDARDTRIREDRAQGIMDIVVPTLPDPYDIRELRDDPNHWMNRCAADFYGLRSISARPSEGS